MAGCTQRVDAAKTALNDPRAYPHLWPTPFAAATTIRQFAGFAARDELERQAVYYLYSQGQHCTMVQAPATWAAAYAMPNFACRDAFANAGSSNNAHHLLFKSGKAVCYSSLGRRSVPPSINL